MRLKLQFGVQELFTHYPKESRVTVEDVMQSLHDSHPDVYKRICDGEGCLRKSIPVFINGEHMRYRSGMATELKAGDNLYIVPFITGG